MILRELILDEILECSTLSIKDRGSTLIQAATGYMRQENFIVLTIVYNRELLRLNEMVQVIDPEAFMIINR